MIAMGSSFDENLIIKKNPRKGAGFREAKAGNGLLSHEGFLAVPSTLTGLTTVFGMGTGVALSR